MPDPADNNKDLGGIQREGSRGVAAPTAVADGELVQSWMNRLGAQMVAVDYAGDAGADGRQLFGFAYRTQTAAADTPSPVATGDHQYNGTGWDRRRGNIQQTAISSAARTATNNSGDLTNYSGRGLHLVIDVTATAATPSLTVTIQGKDALSGQYYTILASTAISTVSTTVLKVYPGLTAAANAAANDILPRTYRILCTHGDADSITYSIGASIVL